MPLECCRLQGFPDGWGDVSVIKELSDEEHAFWLSVRNTHEAINGRKTGKYTKDQMIRWLNKLHTDSAEYKMWGNGIALPCASDVMRRIAEAMKKEEK
jgi:DNA (cytosine-5)-methyltransferase 1